jgi:autotransporter-associated beta strand protein
LNEKFSSVTQLTVRNLYMKNYRSTASKLLATGCCTLLALLALNAKAQSLWFDVNGTTAGYGTAAGGSYSWDDPNWATASGGTTATGNWVSNSFARFLGTNSYTVTVNNTESNAGLAQAPATGTAANNILTINATANGSLDVVPSTSLTAGLPAQGFFASSLGVLYINAPITGSGAVSLSRFNGSGTAEIHLRGTNTYTGGTALSSSSILVYFNNSSSFGTGPICINGTTFAPVLAEGGVPITLPNNWTNVAVAGTNGINFASSANTPVICTGSWVLQTNLNLRNNGNSTAPLTLSGPISGDPTPALTLSANNSGMITLSGANTYTGKTMLGGNGTSGVTLSVASLNSVTGGTPASNLGAPTTVADGTISIGSGALTSTLIYTGPGETTDRVIDLLGTTGGAVLQADGSGPLVFSSDFTASGAGAKTLTLQGANTGDNTISGAIVNSTGATSVTKTGAGTWVLAGTSSYTGATTISNGTLKVNGNIGTSSGVTVNNNGTLQGTGTVPALTLNSGGTIAPANGVGTIISADETWNGGAHYTWQINDAAAAAGTGYDTIAINGALNITASSGSMFNIDIQSLSGSTPGNAANFGTTGTWTLATTTGGITGFDASAFNINTNNLSNSIGNGVLAVSLSADNKSLLLNLLTPIQHYTATGAGTGSFTGSPNTSYTIQYTDSLNPINWQTLTVVTTDNTGAGSYTDAGPLPSQRYYRISAQ